MESTVTARTPVPRPLNRFRRDHNSVIGHTVCNALRTAVAAFDGNSGELVFANRMFHSTFPSGSSNNLVWSATTFSRRFQFISLSISQTATADVELLDPQTGCWFSVRQHMATSELGQLQVIELTDISQRLLEEDRRRNQHRQLLFTSKVMSVGEMAATLAHELNQPIGALFNYLNGGLLRLERSQRDGITLDVGDLQDALIEARHQCERAAAIITRIREFVRTREPKMSLLVLGDVFQGVLALLESELRIHYVETRTDVATEVAPVRADRVMIEQVLHNLAKNAIEAMRSHPGARELLLSASLNADAMIEIAVQDSGPGVADAARDQLFSPFFTTKPDGLGIGLNICRSMIEFHGGSLFYSRPPAGGSCFCFTLPADLDAAAVLP